MKNELDFTATPEYEAWYNANRTKIARQSVFSKGAAVWNAAQMSTEIQLTRDTSGMCRVFIKIGADWVSVIEDNGDIINHMVLTSGIRASIGGSFNAANRGGPDFSDLIAMPDNPDSIANVLERPKTYAPDASAADAKDAERYRQLRNEHIEGVYVWDDRGEKFQECGECITGEKLDAAVDAAIAARINGESNK